MILEAAPRHELVNQEPLLIMSAVANEVDKVGVVKQAQHQHLHDEFLMPLKPLRVQLLHSNNLQQPSPGISSNTTHTPPSAHDIYMHTVPESSLPL